MYKANIQLDKNKGENQESTTVVSNPDELKAKVLDFLNINGFDDGDMFYIDLEEQDTLEENNNKNITDGEETLVVENIKSFKESIKENKRLMTIGGSIAGAVLLILFILSRKAKGELSVSDHSETFNFLLNDYTPWIFSGLETLGIMLFGKGFIDYIKNKNKIKKEELKLTK